MERTKQIFEPQWLRGSGSSNGGGTVIHPLASSSLLHSDDRGSSKLARNRSLVNKNDHSLGRSTITTSSYLHRSSSSNSSANSRASLRNQRNKEGDKDVCEFPNKDESMFSDHRHRDYSDPLENILSSRVGKEGLRRSQSMVDERRGEIWSRKVVADKNGNISGNGRLAGGDTHKAPFGRGFPSLGEKEKLASSEIRRVPSPELSSAIQSLSVSASAMVGGDNNKSALAELPPTVGNNGSGTPGIATATPTSASVPLSKHYGLSMAETVAQGPSRAQTTPQLSTETQRREELAIKQSRQLIPVTPSVPKALVLNPSDKLKSKVQQQHLISSSNPANHSPRGGPVKPDLSRTSTVGKLHVLKPIREKIGVSSTAKDSLSPTNGSKVAHSTAASPLVAASPTVKSSAHISGHPTTERKPVLPLLEKRPTAQSQSRNDFFNLVRKNSGANSSSVPDVAPASSPSALNKPDKMEDATTPATQQNGDAVLSDNCSQKHTPEIKGDRTCNGDSCFGPEWLDNRKSNPSFDSNFFSEEEEAAFLRSLGWEENADEGGLTEEEILAFCRDVSKYTNLNPSWKTPRLSSLESITGIKYSELNSSESKLDLDR